jgi:hypothetical protein
MTVMMPAWKACEATRSFVMMNLGWRVVTLARGLARGVALSAVYENGRSANDVSGK